MEKTPSRNSRIIALAYAHRYAYPAAIIVISLLFAKGYTMLVLGIGFILYALYSLIGYLCRWKHIYCAFQKRHRQEMTPDDICWEKIKKFEAYSVPAILGFIGVAMIVIHFILPQL